MTWITGLGSLFYLCVLGLLFFYVLSLHGFVCGCVCGLFVLYACVPRSVCSGSLCVLFLCLCVHVSVCRCTSALYVYV